jgi:hypothetical protein
MKFTQAKARQTSIIRFRHIDETEQGGVVGGTVRETFSVVSFPRYGDTKSRTFRYEEVAEVLESTPRTPVNLPTFGRLMSGA